MPPLVEWNDEPPARKEVFQSTELHMFTRGPDGLELLLRRVDGAKDWELPRAVLPGKGDDEREGVRSILNQLGLTTADPLRAIESWTTRHEAGKAGCEVLGCLQGGVRVQSSGQHRCEDHDRCGEGRKAWAWQLWPGCVVHCREFGIEVTERESTPLPFGVRRESDPMSKGRCKVDYAWFSIRKL